MHIVVYNTNYSVVDNSKCWDKILENRTRVAWAAEEQNSHAPWSPCSTCDINGVHIRPSSPALTLYAQTFGKANKTHFSQ